MHNLIDSGENGLDQSSKPSLGLHKDLMSQQEGMQVFKAVVGEVCGNGWNEGIKGRVQTSENLHNEIDVVERLIDGSKRVQDCFNLLDVLNDRRGAFTDLMELVAQL